MRLFWGGWLGIGSAEWRLANGCLRHPDRSANRGMAGRAERRVKDRCLDCVVDRCIDVGANAGVSRAEGRLEDRCLDCVVDR